MAWSDARPIQLRRALLAAPALLVPTRPYYAFFRPLSDRMIATAPELIGAFAREVVRQNSS